MIGGRVFTGLCGYVIDVARVVARVVAGAGDGTRGAFVPALLNTIPDNMFEVYIHNSYIYFK
jgi:hypothetical protein